MKKCFFIISFFLVLTNVYSQVRINEVMYAPTSPAKEWFEIYNIGTTPVDLQNWKWKDAAVSNPIRTITTQSVILNPNTFAIVCEDSANLRQNFPGITGIILQSIGWNALNNTGNENIVLYNSTSLTQDSLTYTNTWGGSGGFSLERINPAGATNLQSNWGTSLDPNKGTPDRTNSITPKQYDLILKSFVITPANPLVGDSLKFRIEVKNIGINSANNFIVKLFRDLNLDSIPQPGEIINSQNYSVLNSNDSLFFNYAIGNIDSGFKQYIGFVEFTQDEDTLNNKSVKSINVGGTVVTTGIFVNEIMYAPQSPEPEWVEIFNNSNNSVNIKNWKIADSTTLSSPIVITASDYFIQANSYLVIAKSNSILPKHPLLDTSKVIYLSNLPTLNNDKDVVAIFNNAGVQMDYVSYKSNWGGSSRNSLERITANKPSNDSSNWATSIDCEYSTPTRVNSFTNVTAYSRNDLIINEIMPDPITGEAEWLELYNPTTKTLNLTGWKLSESSYFHNLSDTCSFFINPGGYLIVSGDTNIYKRFSYLRNLTSNQKIILVSGLSLSNDGEVLKVYDVLNNLIDSVNYSPKWHNPNLADTKGYSLEKINPLLGSNDMSNWTSCANPLGGTPGLINSVFISNPSTTSKITVSPNPFSPDGDGFEEVTFINYKLSSPVAQIRIKIYDVKGRLVRNLINNQVSGAEGTIIFNGYDDGGQRLRIGIYIVYLEAVDGAGGTVDAAKATVVIATKL